MKYAVGRVGTAISPRPWWLWRRWRWGPPKGGAALPRAHPSHCPGDPSTLGPLLVGHETPSSANRWLVPLEASAPEDSPSMPSPSPLETTRGTVIIGPLEITSIILLWRNTSLLLPMLCTRNTRR